MYTSLQFEFIPLPFGSCTAVAIKIFINCLVPLATGNQQEELENFQNLVLRIIYPGLERYNERLAAANISTLSEHLDNVRRKYGEKVKDNSSHVLHHLIPKRPETIRYSRRFGSSDIYLPRTRTMKCDENVLRNLKYLFSQAQCQLCLCLTFYIFFLPVYTVEQKP